MKSIHEYTFLHFWRVYRNNFTQGTDYLCSVLDLRVSDMFSLFRTLRFMIITGPVTEPSICCVFLFVHWLIYLLTNHSHSSVLILIFYNSLIFLYWIYVDSLEYNWSTILLVSTVWQCESTICIHTPLWFSFPSHLGHHRALSRVPCAVQQVLMIYLFYI